MNAGPPGPSPAWSADCWWREWKLPGPTKLGGLRKAFGPLKYIPYVFLEVLDFLSWKFPSSFPPRPQVLHSLGGGVVSGWDNQS